MLKQKEAVEKLRKSPYFEDQKSNEELKILLAASKEELFSLKESFSFEREKFKGIEKELVSCKDHIKDLEYKNSYAQSQIIEKDRVLSRYLSEMLILKQEVEKLINPSLSNNIKNSINLLYSSEKTIEYLPIEEKTQEIALVEGKSFKFYENEILRLQTQLFETQELYGVTQSQFKELCEKYLKLDSEFFKLKNKLKDSKNEFSQISSQILRNSNDRDFQSKSLIVEIEELRKKREEQDLEIVKIEERYKNSLAEVELDLEKSRNKILEMIEFKTKLENEISGLRSEKKEFLLQIQFKDLKIFDLTNSIQNSAQELTILKNLINSKNSEFSQKNKFNIKLSEVTQENEELKEKIKIYETERLTRTSENKINSKTIVQQLSCIILSRDTNIKEVQRNLSKILIENQDIFSVFFN